jgi:hypothetical protein
MLGSHADSRELAAEHTFTLGVHTFPQILMMRDTLLRKFGSVFFSSRECGKAALWESGKARPAEN